jgi:hypothetical protein
MQYIYNFKIHAKIMTDAHISDFKFSNTSGKWTLREETSYKT